MVYEVSIKRMLIIEASIDEEAGRGTCIPPADDVIERIANDHDTFGRDIPALSIELGLGSGL